MHWGQTCSIMDKRSFANIYLKVNWPLLLSLTCDQGVLLCVSGLERHATNKHVIYRNCYVTVFKPSYLYSYWVDLYQIHVFFVLHIHNLTHQIWTKSTQQFARYFSWKLPIFYFLFFFAPFQKYYWANQRLHFVDHFPLKAILAYLGLNMEMFNPNLSNF